MPPLVVICTKPIATGEALVLGIVWLPTPALGGERRSAPLVSSVLNGFLPRARENLSKIVPQKSHSL